MNDHQHCQELKAYLSDYIDGVLSDDLCQVLEQHIAECQNCQIVVNTLRKTIDLVHTTSVDTPVPDGIRTRLFHRLNLDDFLDK
jgi:anti-sigma factor RsiW